MDPDVYLRCGDFIVRRSYLNDVDELKDCLRKSDIDEIWASHHHTPAGALYSSLTGSSLCLSIENKKKCICMFGINPESLMGTKATIWLLASSELDKNKVKFIKHGKKFVEMFLTMYPYLFNYVHDKNKKSIAWLKSLGARIEEAKPYGMEGLPFHYFSFERTS